MNQFEELFHTAHRKTEKLVPVLECPEQIEASEFSPAKETLAKKITHPNTAEHDTRWISVYSNRGEKSSPTRQVTLSPVPAKNR